MVTRKFFTTLSSDDKPWGAEIDSVEDLNTFLEVPGNWLANNVDIRCVLAQDFLIKIRETSISPPATGKLYLTGNSGTNVVTVFIPSGFFTAFLAFLQNQIVPDAGQPASGPFVPPEPPEMEAVLSFLGSSIPTVQIDTLIISEAGATKGRAITHYSVTQGVPASAAARMILIAGHILKMMGDDTYRYQILETNANDGHQTVTYLAPDGTPNPPNPLPKVTFNSFTSPGDVSIEYIGNDHSTFEACDMLVGTYDFATATITIEEGYIKSYT
ncbi:MAG TPA: hypothetical protein VG820_13465, partial [Fimbriimonadaceae bacterium]|nr:hypothetical protein [Fimbriimonadaceae bacterium]